MYIVEKIIVSTIEVQSYYFEDGTAMRRKIDAHRKESQYQRVWCKYKIPVKIPKLFTNISEANNNKHETFQWNTFAPFEGKYI